MSSSSVNHISQPCIYGHFGSSTTERKSRLMKWLSKLFKGGSDDNSRTSKERKRELDRVPALSLAEDLKRPKECFLCRACGAPITEYEIPTNGAGLIEYRCHPFWSQKYCPAHENDNTKRCCSCERLSHGMQDICHLEMVELCFECMESAIMDTETASHFYYPHQRLITNLRTLWPITCLETRGLCLSEILHEIPVLLTGAILAHELMHAWLRLKGYRNLSPEIEEGICQVLSHMWLESEIAHDASPAYGGGFELLMQP
ncbi:hypothetical protein HAX54_000010 [Datura stramonium]|uniref:Protein DA1-like domain-containing protein n=1 Tax=Datura stramonium TaxID=4076 RepID=A0ABS8RFJ6_DATST|nr:hypothetical protein [Datura stramonium]